jgi:3-hexulose-6-phosphate synthase
LYDLNISNANPATSDILFQLSLDLKDLDEAVEMARLGVEAGVQVLEAGTILILSESGQRVLPRLKAQFPGHPVVADVKCTDGVGPEVGLMFDLGASKATVMASASDASIRNAVAEAAKRPGCQVMVDTMGFGGPDGTDVQGQIDAARRARDLGAHYVVLHLGYDERTANRKMVEDNLLLRWAEAVAKEDLGIPIQVVGGLTLAQAAELPGFGINEIVISMNLGSRPMDETRYDAITAFTVNLSDPADRNLVVQRLKQFMDEVRG